MMYGTHNVTLTHCNMMHGTHNVILTHCNLMHGTHFKMNVFVFNNNLFEGYGFLISVYLL